MGAEGVGLFGGVSGLDDLDIERLVDRAKHGIRGVFSGLKARVENTRDADFIPHRQNQTILHN